MATPTNLTETGGIAVVVLADRFTMPDEYAQHAQVHPLPLADLAMDLDGLNRQIPPTTKMVLIGGELPSTTYASVRRLCERRSLTYVQRRNPPALTETLRTILPGQRAAPESSSDAGPRAAPTPPKKGSLGAFVREHAQLGKGSAEEGRRLFPLARAAGIETTIGSITQAISVEKRRGGRTETPKSLMTAQQRVLGTLDDAIAGLALVREYVAETEVKNAALTEKLAKLTAILSGS